MHNFIRSKKNLDKSYVDIEASRDYTIVAPLYPLQQLKWSKVREVLCT